MTIQDLFEGLGEADFLELSKGVLLKAIQRRAKVGDMLAAKDITAALDNIGPLMAACRWDDIIKRATVLLDQSEGGGL